MHYIQCIFCLLFLFSSSWAGKLFQRYGWDMLRFLPACADWICLKISAFQKGTVPNLECFLSKSSQSRPTCRDPETLMELFVHSSSRHTKCASSQSVHLHCQGRKGSKISALHWARCKSWWMMFVQITEETTKLVSLVSLGDGSGRMDDRIWGLWPVVAKVGRYDGIERLGSTEMRCDVSNMEEIRSVTNLEVTYIVVTVTSLFTLMQCSVLLIGSLQDHHEATGEAGGGLWEKFGEVTEGPNTDAKQISTRPCSCWFLFWDGLTDWEVRSWRL